MPAAMRLVVHGGGGQQGGHGGMALRDIPVGENQQAGARFHLPGGIAAQGFQGAGQPLPAFSQGPADRQVRRPQVLVAGSADGRQACRCQDGMRQLKLAAVQGRFGKEIALATNGG
jgi:hypothetical protein